MVFIIFHEIHLSNYRQAPKSKSLCFDRLSSSAGENVGSVVEAGGVQLVVRRPVSHQHGFDQSPNPIQI